MLATRNMLSVAFVMRRQRNKQIFLSSLFGTRDIMANIISNRIDTTPAPVGLPVLRRIDPAVQTPPDLALHFLRDVLQNLTLSGGEPVVATAAMERLFVECKRLRDHLSASEWLNTVHAIRGSGILSVVHQDAFTSRAFSKPRGYAGDAVMMDYIYGREENWANPPMSEIGNRVFGYTTSAAASAGVRARREFIANMLDDSLQRNSSQDVLAVASGHLREASMSAAVRRRRFRSFLAIDADRDSLEVVNDSYGHLGIETEVSDIRKLIVGKSNLGQFDLIYSTGLYDYLNEKISQRLTFHLFSSLRSGGRLVIANFLPSIPDVGYMEACMDWFLIYRNRIDMMAMTAMIDQDSIRDIRISTEENKNIIFIEIAKA
jgi:extracellular factor (EF) 3-hydroxypalmitic acid methyl ester biosynthesis protein